MSLVQIILVVIVAFIIGCSSVNDQIETYQPVVACSLIGLVTGHLELGVMLGGSLQLITMGWANVGAAWHQMPHLPLLLLQLSLSWVVKELKELVLPSPLRCLWLLPVLP